MGLMYTSFITSLLRIQVPVISIQFPLTIALNCAIQTLYFQIYLSIGSLPKRFSLIVFQVQRVKVEKQLVEKQRFEVEEKFKRLSRQAEELNRKFEELREEKEQLVKENSRLKQQVRNCRYFNCRVNMRIFFISSS